MSRLLLPDLRCSNPKCGRRPPIRITEAMLRLARQCEPGEVLGTWQCRCNVIHPITATDYQRAA